MATPFLLVFDSILVNFIRRPRKQTASAGFFGDVLGAALGRGPQTAMRQMMDAAIGRFHPPLLGQLLLNLAMAVNLSGCRSRACKAA